MDHIDYTARVLQGTHRTIEYDEYDEEAVDAISPLDLSHFSTPRVGMESTKSSIWNNLWNWNIQPKQPSNRSNISTKV